MHVFDISPVVSCIYEGNMRARSSVRIFTVSRHNFNLYIGYIVANTSRGHFLQLQLQFLSSADWSALSARLFVYRTVLVAVLFGFVFVLPVTKFFALFRPTTFVLSTCFA